MKKGIPIRKKLALETIYKEYTAKNGYLSFNSFRDIQDFVLLLQEKNIQTSPGELKCVLLITDINRYLLKSYMTKFAQETEADVKKQFVLLYGEKQFTELKTAFEQEFTGIDIFPENIVINLSNLNPAFKEVKQLFDDSMLKKDSRYSEYFDVAEDYLKDQQPVSDGRSIIELMRLPMQKHPDSLYDQLGFIKSNFSDLLGDFVFEISESMDALKEEITFRDGSPGIPEVYEFYDEPEYENFTEDKDWMSTLTLLAKSVYVWLAQLSQKYNTEITSLDQIPDEELKNTARRGFRGIWLIGIWERSDVSRNFKRIKGNYDALSSAYSLKKYEVAEDLGGKSAMHNLKVRAGKYGVKIACDMVPNHTAVDSDWIADHPDWFVQTDDPPYPSYTFHSQNLSQRDDVQVYLEDKYYDETDAAVVFKAVSRKDGKTRYIYHGNDGTSIPWSDTAQLNYLLPEVREEVINLIINIAKEFPVIRFDAAMTLAKKHFQRLWYPEPGNAGAIPSRHLYTMSKAEFNKVFPVEFWREVVDRCAVEAPDTLLLAEAFWMMEGYFVRTLGMHRVYNSAFMNMLKREENNKYRESIKNIIDFNPEILKRFVNFMSNPDEETAIAQFGTDDKYFGVCVLMVTMPGLPMFAHGQIEGFTERYGMEYSAPKLQEQVNEYLVERHNKEIFPLLHKRQLFSDAANFTFYDFTDFAGNTNENIFAYSNEFEGKRNLVIYNNSYTEPSGSIKFSKTEKVNTDLGNEWNLHNQENYFILLKDEISGKVFIRNSKGIYSDGMKLDLKAYEYHVYTDVTEVCDEEGKYSKLCRMLDNSGSIDIHKDFSRIEYSEILGCLKNILHPDLISNLMHSWEHSAELFGKTGKAEIKFRISTSAADFKTALKCNPKENDTDKIIANIEDVMVLEFSDFTKQEAVLLLLSGLFTPLVMHLVAGIGGDWFRKVPIIDLLEETISKLSYKPNSNDIAEQVPVFSELLSGNKQDEFSFATIKEILELSIVKDFIEVNEFDKVFWFKKEKIEGLVKLFMLKSKLSKKVLSKPIIKQFEEIIQDSSYKYETLLKLLSADKKNTE